MPVDLYVVWGVREYDLRLVAAHQAFDHRAIGCIAADELVVAKRIVITQPRLWRTVELRIVDRVQIIVLCGKVVAYDPVDLADREPGKRQIEGDVVSLDFLQLEAKRVHVPIGVGGHSVGRDAKGAKLGVAEVFDPQNRNGAQLQLHRDFNAEVTVDDDVAGVDDNRADDALRADALEQRPPLLRRMLPRAADRGGQVAGANLDEPSDHRRAVGDLEYSGLDHPRPPS